MSSVGISPGEIEENSIHNMDFFLNYFALAVCNRKEAISNMSYGLSIFQWHSYICSNKQFLNIIVKYVEWIIRVE